MRTQIWTNQKPMQKNAGKLLAGDGVLHFAFCTVPKDFTCWSLSTLVQDLEVEAFHKYHQGFYCISTHRKNIEKQSAVALPNIIIPQDTLMPWSIWRASLVGSSTLWSGSSAVVISVCLCPDRLASIKPHTRLSHRRRIEQYTFLCTITYN